MIYWEVWGSAANVRMLCQPSTSADVFSAAIPGSKMPRLLKESFCIHPVIFHVGSSINPLGRAPKPLDPVCGWSNGTWAWISTALLEIHPHK